LEDSEDYKAFELSVTSDFDARTAVGRDLVLRLASLLWRLRRATAIETDLLQIQSEILGETRRAQGTKTQAHHLVLDAIGRLTDRPADILPDAERNNRRADCDPPRQHDGENDLTCLAEPPLRANVEVGRCFLRLANLDNGAFDRLNRYETGLWRQVGHSLYA
jgi:hypothetical protein